jgi:hypothetical protein
LNKHYFKLIPILINNLQYLNDRPIHCSVFYLKKGFFRNYLFFFRTRSIVLLAVLINFYTTTNVFSQAINALQTSFASGGFSEINGPSSLFINPANLMINTYKNGNQIELGALFSETIIQQSLPTSLSSFKSSFLYPILYDSAFEPDSYNLKNSNQGNLTLSATPFQASFHFTDWSLGIAVRTRLNSNYSLSKNWFNSINPTNTSRTYESESSHWNELTIGFARSIDYLNFLNNNFNRFYVGFSVSFITPISHEKTSILENIVTNGDSQKSLVSSSEIQYAGQISSIFDSITQPKSVLNPLEITDLVSVKGFGAGINIGLSYEIPFESTYKQVIDGKPITKYWRFSLAITDLGYMKFSDGITHLSAPIDTITTALSSFQPVLNKPFSFSISDSRQLLRNSETLASLNRASKFNDSETRLFLPTQIKAGFILSYHWFKVGSDLFYGLNTSMNNIDGICITGYSELKLIPFLPLRAGVLIEEFKPKQISAGLGLDLWNFSWDVALVYSTNSINPNQPKAFAATGLRFRF